MSHFITAIVSLFLGMYLHAEYMFNMTASKAVHKTMMSVPHLDWGIVLPLLAGLLAVIYQVKRNKRGVRRRR